jgi:hypothetical protein
MATRKAAVVTLTHKGQTLEGIHRVVAQMLGRAGCDRCGRLSILQFEFLGDPAPDLTKDGIVAIGELGFGG